MQNPALGRVDRDGDSGEGLARVSYGSRSIEIRIIGDAISYAEAVEVASSVAKDLHNLDALAKQVAALELTEMYNNGWNEYDEMQEDGTITAVSNPQLTEQEFERKLTLNGVSVTGNMLDFFYENQNMFWGHCVLVTSMDGVAFNDTHAEIFG